MNQQAAETGRHKGTTTIRTQHQKISRVTILVDAPVAGLIAYFTSGINHIFGLLLVCVSIIGAVFLSRFLLLRFAVGTFLNPTGPFIEDIANRTDDEILVNEFVRLGGKAASLAAAKLQNNIGSATVMLKAEPKNVLECTRSFFRENGVLLKNDSNERSSEIVKGLLGCGKRQLNPALVTISLKNDQNHLQVNISGVAKEGMIKQHAGEEAATILVDYLRAIFEESTNPP